MAERARVVLVVAVGGALGSLARWGLGAVLGGTRDGFPWSTFLVNISGAFAVGVLVVVAAAKWPHSRLVRPFVGVGLLGGYTTFSAYMAETHHLIDADQGALAGAYLFSTVVLGLLAVALGMSLAGHVVDSPAGGEPG